MTDTVRVDFPRLLVFSHVVPESRYAGSLLLLRLLKDYPAEKLLVIGHVPHLDSEILPCRYEEVRAAPLSRLYRTRLAQLKRSFDAFGIGGEVSIRDAERHALAFRPDVVLTVMQESQYYCSAYRFCSRNSVPLVILVHDLVELFEPVFAWAARRQRERNAVVYRSAAANFCISSAMARRLHQDYGVEASVLYPNRSDVLTPRPPSANNSLRNKARLTIGYAGSLSYGYGEGIQSILPALKSAGAVLRIYSAQAPQWTFDNVEYAGFSPSPAHTWERVKEECDVVLLPYAWSENFQDLYEVHFPSKLPEYLALGMPVLISGPSYAAGVAWGMQHPRAALTISNPSEKAMHAACVRLRNDARLRDMLATEAIEVGREEFDPALIRGQFLEKLREVVAHAAPSKVSVGLL